VGIFIWQAYSGEKWNPSCSFRVASRKKRKKIKRLVPMGQKRAA